MDNITRRDNEMAYISDRKVMMQQFRSKFIARLYSRTIPFNRPVANVYYKLLGIKHGKGAYFEPPFRVDYGFNIEVGDNFYANSNCIILDVGKVKIGDNVMFGPNVSIITAGHPIHPESRRSRYEYGMPITIGNDVWIGTNTVICPGASVGNGCVIGAGSVVTKAMPDNTVCVGNPCRVLREITDEDRKYLYKKQEFDSEAWKEICELYNWPLDK
ncbi:MAG: sugar O-acetyltransferase [Faecalibacterium sp.]|nr:sugar O-acetyltransferase [Ruminococcus sp.]MCM1392829.1 sugar O-acetyltransferase [Ruminococcus sp.]MCM1485693.1 sugar O-acetyltransferase [Faecalibacterium sp.]